MGKFVVKRTMAFFYTRLFLTYLTMTIAVETPVLFLIVRYGWKMPPEVISARIILLAGFLASFCTYPYLWYVVPELIADPQTALVFGETAIVLVESFLLLAILRIPFLPAFLASFICNLVSLAFGTFLNKMIVQYRLMEKISLIFGGS
jgi:hypothetical protein